MIKIDEKKLKGYTFIDLFAGIGGFHMAMASFGAQCVFASEWDKDASKTYFDNFNITPYGDITKINESDIPSHDFICGGFPCQAFSISGKQKGFDDTRGTLFFDIARIIDYHRPRFLLLENVKNLVSHDSGRTLKTILTTLNDLGYNVFYKVLNSSHFGLPQHRLRVYFVGFRKDLEIDNFIFPNPPNNYVSLKDILEMESDHFKFIDRPDIKFYKSYSGLFDINCNKPLQIGRVNKGGQGERIYDINGHSITLSAYGGGPGAKTGLYYVDNKIRKLSPRECARVQGFPDNFKLNQKNTQAYKQFGNSVSVNVLQYLIKSMINHFSF